VGKEHQCKTVAVTGGSGRLGTHVVRELLSQGYQVRVLDRRAPSAAVEFVQLDTLDLDCVREALRGVDAVIHLAAIDFDFQAPAEDYIRVNTLGTWHVLQAANELGIQRAVVCSSISACGLSEANAAFPPEQLPVDESHPRYVIQPYSVSKVVIEEMAASFVRRGEMAVLCLRPMMVLTEPNIDPTVARAQDEETRWLFYYVTPQDCARAFRCALEAESVRGGEFFITAQDSCRDEETLVWYERAWGRLPAMVDVEHYRRNPRASVFSGDKARDQLGFVASSNWRELLAGRAQAPADSGAPQNIAAS